MRVSERASRRDSTSNSHLHRLPAVQSSREGRESLEEEESVPLLLRLIGSLGGVDDLPREPVEEVGVDRDERSGVHALKGLELGSVDNDGSGEKFAEGDQLGFGNGAVGEESEGLGGERRKVQGGGRKEKRLGQTSVHNEGSSQEKEGQSQKER